MKKAVLYRRVSSQRQANQGRSLDDQRTDLLKYCKDNKMEVIGDFADTMSGRGRSTSKRVEFKQAVDLCCREKATLVCWHWDRFARNAKVGMRTLFDMQDCGANVAMLSLNIDTNDPMGLAMAHVVLVQAEYESKKIGERVKLANAQTVKRIGYRTQGEQPFGWKIQDGKRVRVPEEQAALKRMKELHKRNWSYGLIVEALNAEGHKPRHAKTWTRGSVHRLLNQRKR